MTQQYLLIGDVRDKLRELSADSVDCVVTSPPYWGEGRMTYDHWKATDQSESQFDDESIYEDEIEQAMDDCGSHRQGQCDLFGSEWCDWKCPFSDSVFKKRTRQNKRQTQLI